MKQFSIEKLFKSDILAMRLCFLISVILCATYNISVILLYEEKSNLFLWWVNNSSILSDRLSLFIPAFGRVLNEMNYLGYAERIILFKNVMSINFIIVILSFIIEIIFSLITYFISENYVYKIFVERIMLNYNNKTGKSFSIKRSRVAVAFMFLMISALLYSGLSFIVPSPLYTENYKILFVGLIYIGDLCVNFGFLISFVVMPFWVKPPMGV